MREFREINLSLTSFTKEGKLKKGVIRISNTEEKPDCKMKNAKN